ncbi:MAG TPA: hypothetical protein VHN73_09695 [Phenylobacterium sp.]|nr:hypothetical protein [Phenylobacterium sp.]
MKTKFMAALVTGLAVGAVMGASQSLAAGTTAVFEGNWEALFIQGLDDFLGKRTGDYILPTRSVSEQVWEGLGDSPSLLDIKQLDNGAILVPGCRLHSCGEKAAVVVSSGPRNVQAIGIVNFHCRYVGAPAAKSRRQRWIDCDDTPTLTLFLRRNDVYRTELEHWAETAVGRPMPSEVIWMTDLAAAPDRHRPATPMSGNPR